MTRITLQSRPSLSKRIQAFGGANGRGSNRVYRFGDVTSDRAAIEAARVAVNYSVAGTLLRSSDWAALYAQDPSWTQDAYEFLRSRVLEPEIIPPLEQVLHLTPTPSPVVVSDPVPVINTPPPVATPGTSDAAYQAAVVAAQIEAARLQAVATANQATLREESKRMAAEDALAQRAEADRQAAILATTEPKKSSPLPWLIAAGVVIFALKG